MERKPRRRLQLDLPADLWKRVDEVRETTGCTYTSFVRLAVQERLDRLAETEEARNLRIAAATLSAFGPG